MRDKPENDWERAQAEWDQARRASGSIPPLPRRNSNVDRHDGNAVEQRGRFVADAKTNELPGTKTLDYLGLGLLLATPAVVVDMYLKGENINWRRTVIATVLTWLAGGFAVWASHRWQSWRTSVPRLLPYLTAFEGKFWGRAIIVALAMGFALGVSSILSNDQGRSPVGQAGKLWDPLKDEQETSLERALGAITKRFPVMIICVDANCRELAGNFIGAFHNTGWNVNAAFSGFPTEPIGLVLYQPDINDKSLATAIESSTGLKIERIESSSIPNTTSLFFGTRP